MQANKLNEKKLRAIYKKALRIEKEKKSLIGDLMRLMPDASDAYHVSKKASKMLTHIEFIIGD